VSEGSSIDELLEKLIDILRNINSVLRDVLKRISDALEVLI